MEVRLALIQEHESSSLYDLLMTYLSEMQAFSKDVELSYPYFDLYWKEEERSPYWIKIGEKIAGFVLINDYVMDFNFNADRSIAEFYVMPSFRKFGIGKKIMDYTFKNTSYPKWEIRCFQANHSSLQFWKSVLEKWHTQIYEKDDQMIFLVDLSISTDR